MPQFAYLFGPVPSRRFGLSLGVDLAPMKTCTLDCPFCEVGPTTRRTLERREYVPTGAVLQELEAWRALKQPADFITVTGSGEPTLHTRFGEVLEAIRAMGGAKAALLTNSTLMHLPEVRAAAARADVVKASQSAWDQASFEAVVCPHPGLSFDRLAEGLRAFRREYAGAIWMEVFLTPGVNTAPDQVAALAALARTIEPDRIQLNTAVRPTARQDVAPLPEDRLRALAGHFTPRAEVIARFAAGSGARREGCGPAVLDMLRRRPCTAGDVARSFGLPPDQAEALLQELAGRSGVQAEARAGETFYRAV